jgi:hypothetical protein
MQNKVEPKVELKVETKVEPKAEPKVEPKVEPARKRMRRSADREIAWQGTVAHRPSGRGGRVCGEVNTWCAD